MPEEKIQNKPQMRFGVDPMRTPILYADAIRVNSNDNGMVLDIAQGIAGSDQAMIVARIGLSKEHAKKLAEIIAQHVVRQGEFTTGKMKILN